MKFYGWDSREISLDKWMELVETTDRHVGYTNLRGGRRVSTVLIGIDYSFGYGGALQIFETMIFPDCALVARYATLKAAQAGHRRCVRALRRARLGLPVLIHKGGKP
jgi:hypothetical protein